jgi:Ser/Thr protein kinase RdoA (MazF antagonist)
MPNFTACSTEHLATLASQFTCQQTITGIQAFGNGNINDTFLVQLTTQEHFILQRINTQVFRQPQQVMQNMRIVTEHVCDRLQQVSLESNRRWEMPRVLLTQTNGDHWIDEAGLFWRAISFIKSAQSIETITNSYHAAEVGYGLGLFHRLMSDLPPTSLADTLEGFHITPHYLQQYDQICRTVAIPNSPEVNYCQQFVGDRRAWVPVLETAKAHGKLPLRTMHGDPKVNNVLLDAVTGQAVSMIDLDTVKPGLVHYDIGDCLRSGCNPAGEETESWETVQFEPDLCQALLHGYFSVAQEFFTPQDYDYLFDAIRLIAFELGLRFFTDFLAGNVYFKAKFPEHNLARALVQFRLTESIEAQAKKIHKIISDCR